MMKPAILNALVLAFVGASTLPLFAQQPRFTEVALASGVAFQHQDPGQLMSAGAAFLDYDRDGWPDIYLTGGINSSRLYRNLGNGTFLDVTVSAGLQTTGTAEVHPMCVSVGDFDGDGWPDLFLGYKGPNRLYRNRGDGTFAEVVGSAVAGNAFTTGAAFGDYDGDGDLDLYVGDYIEVLNYPYHTPYGNLLYRNDGTGHFTDVTAAEGVAGAGTTLAVDWSDFDDDGDLDLLVGNDFGAFVQPNRVYRNDGVGLGQGGGRFTELSQALGADIAIYCMGITMGDYDRDGDLDGYFSNLGRNVLLRNEGASGFTDVTDACGVGNTFDLTSGASPLFATSWSVAFQDFDQDGWLDLHVSNGHIPSAPSIANGLTTPAALFHHQGASETFVDIAASAGVDDPGIGRGSAYADYDRDGDIDILQANCSGPARLYRNDTPNAGHWSQLRLASRLGDTDAIGARVRATTPGGVLQVREVDRNLGFESSSDPTVHMGLGPETGLAELDIRWPSGVRQSWTDLPGDRRHAVLEPVLDVLPSSSAPATVRPGEVFHARIEVVSRSSHPVTGWHLLEIRDGSSVIFRSGPIAIALPPGAPARYQVQLTVPSAPVPAAPIDLKLRWSVVDALGGGDQWCQEVTLTP